MLHKRSTTVSGVIAEQRDLLETIHLNLLLVWRQLLPTASVRGDNALSQLPRPGKTSSHQRQRLGSVGEGGL